MHTVRWNHKFPGLILVAVMAALFLNCEKIRENPNTLAIVGKKVIDKDYFLQRYNEFRQRSSVSDNGMARRSVLNNLIAEELLIQEARNRGYDEDAMGRHEHERIKVQELLNAYHNRFIARRISTTEEELKQLFINLNIKLKARHLYAPTRSQADSLYQRLQQGVPFEELAKTSFQDPVLRESGGLLGYFTVDEMDPAFEEAAYALKVGEFSRPIRTNDGYSIIRVEDRIGNPLVTETEFAKHRPKLEAYWKKRKIATATRHHADSLRNALKINFNEPIVHELVKILNQQKEAEIGETINPSHAISPQLENVDLAYSQLGTWDVKKFQEAAQFTSQKERGWIKNDENLKDFIAGLIIRSFIVTEAKKHKLDKTSDYQQQVIKDFETALLERVEAALYQEFEIPEDTLRYYYEDDPSLYAEPPRVQLQQIKVSDTNKINWITSQLTRGVSFTELAKKYSDQRQSAANGGDIGYLTPNDMGKWAKQILTMKVGDWIGPLDMNPSYVFLKCVDKIAAKARSFEAAKQDVEKNVRIWLWPRVRQQKIDELRTRVTVKSFPERLMTLRLEPSG